MKILHKRIKMERLTNSTLSLKPRLTILVLLLSFVGLQAKTDTAFKLIFEDDSSPNASALAEGLDKSSNEVLFVSRNKGAEKVNVESEENRFLSSSTEIVGNQPQTINVSGSVTDEEGIPLPGVNVMEKGTNNGTSTDFDGNFVIEVSEEAVLEVSSLGYDEQEVEVNGQDEITIVMTTSSSELDEVVLIGYQSVKKKDLTGAVSVYDTKEMENRSVTGGVGEVLGTLPGISVRTEGKPGSEGKVELRGTGTFGSSAPLFVVDGVVSGANRDFNYNDIESIQVLKDASAAAIYGSRAGNGVIIIETKKGRNGRMKIDLSSKATAQWLPKYNLTNREEWIKLNDLAFENAGLSPANHSEGNTDWQNETFKTGWVQDHNIAISGGSEKTKYFYSGNFQSNSGTTIGTQNKRLTLRSNTSTVENFGDNLKLEIGENIAFSNYNVDELSTNPIIDVFRMLPTIPIMDPNNEAKGGFGYGDGNRDVTFGTNPFAREALEDVTNSNFRIRGNAFANLDIFKNFKYKFNFGFDLSNDKYHHLRKEGHWTHNQPEDPSFLNKNQAQSQQLIFDNTLEFNKEFNKHNLSAVVGTSFQRSNYKFIFGEKNDVIQTGSGYFNELDAALSGGKTGSHTDYERLFSVFGRINYDYDNRYLMSFTIRRDESSKFSPSNKVGYFPSGSIGWRISEEDFFNVEAVNDLKLRANYGVLGTSNIGPWDWVPLINVFPQVAFGTDQHVETGMTQVQLSNVDLSWEKMHQFDVGLDAEFFDSKLLLSVDYFDKKTSDVLTPMQILDVTGNNGGDPVVNAATLQNRGVEISTTWRETLGDFNYRIDLNFSYLKNKIKELGYGRDEFTQWDTKSRVGHSIGDWFLIKTDGLFQSQEDVMNYTNSEGKVIQPNARPGDVKFVDYNDDGKITDEDRQYLGSSIPKYEASMNLGVGYKGFDLQVQLAGAFGFKSYNAPRSAYDRFDDNSNYRANYDPWTPDNMEARDPRPIYGDSRNVRAEQDRWLEDGSYLKVKQIALGYDFPKAMIGPLDNLRVFVNLQNMITITSYGGLDPEFLNTNIFDRSYDPSSFPNPRGITFGLNVGL